MIALKYSFPKEQMNTKKPWQYTLLSTNPPDPIE